MNISTYSMRAMRLVWNGSSCDDYEAKVNRFTELFYVVFTTKRQ